MLAAAALRIIARSCGRELALRNGSALLFKAGPAAYRDIRKRGFSEERIGTIAGASGGAKWLVLSQLDKLILERVVPRLAGPVHLIGSSIGAWRFACYGQPKPVEAIECFENAYIEQTFSPGAGAAEITATSRRLLQELLGSDGAAAIVDHRMFRTHILTVRSRFLTASDRRALLAPGLMLAMTANAINRRALGAFFARGLFFDPRDLPPCYGVRDFPIDHISLTSGNVFDAVMASGSIPVVLSGVRGIEGAPPGTYRDGGVIDYHLDLPLADPDRLVFYPHFFDWLTPGWFDRRLGWRKLDPRNTDRTVLVCPSPDFIAALPHGKVPDRTDFVTMTDAQRMQAWRKAVAECRRLADELDDVLERGALAARLLPL